MQCFRKLTKSLFLNMDFKNNAEFERKYTAISLQRGMLFKKVTGLLILVLSIAYIIVYNLLKKSPKYQFSWVSKTVICYFAG